MKTFLAIDWFARSAAGVCLRHLCRAVPTRATTSRRRWNIYIKVRLSPVVEASAMATDTTSTTSGSTRSSTNDRTSRDGGSNQDFRSKANEAISKVTDAAQQAGAQAKQQASSLAADAKEKTKGYFNQQVASGADLASHVAKSIECAADNLDPKAPQVASLVRSAADRLETFSGDIRDQSVDDLLRTASDFTRRQPAVVFGLASLAGFFLFRALKAKPEQSASNNGRSAMDSSTGRSFENRPENRPMNPSSGLGQPMGRSYGP
jgi:ElaB/YqjD/DUF883 family membrane-anchored ribosome-binding protein